MDANTEVRKKILSGEFVLCNKPAKSRVWQIFSQVITQDGEKVSYVWCKSCEKAYRYNHAQTSNLLKHSCVVKKFASLQENAETSFTEDVDDKNLLELFTKCVIENRRSSVLMHSSSVKDIFKKVLKVAAKLENEVDVENLLPSISEVSENISDVHNRIFESIKVDIASVKENGFGLTNNIWMDNLTNESYIALTIHYLHQGVLTYRLLGFQTLEGNLNGDHNISEVVTDILEEFNCQLSEKCIFVSDKASRFKNTLKDSQNLPCISDLLNNMILKSIEEVPKVSEILNGCFKLINPLKKKNPDILCGNLTLKSHHNRSLVICKMLNLILINWQQVEQILENTKLTKICFFTKTEILAIMHVLQPFEEAIETLEDDSQPTLHLVMAYLHELTKYFNTSSETYNNLDFIESFQEIILSNISDIMMKDITAVHKIAVFLYPPTNKLLPYNVKEQQSVEDECIRIMKSYTLDTRNLTKQGTDIESQDSPICKRKKLLTDFLETSQNHDPVDLIKQEIQNYKKTRVSLTPAFNVFKWWEMQKGNFPLLYKLSSVVLATPATSAASKRILLNARNLINEKYGDDSTEMDVEKIMFIRANAPAAELQKYF